MSCRLALISPPQGRGEPEASGPSCLSLALALKLGTLSLQQFYSLVLRNNRNAIYPLKPCHGGSPAPQVNCCFSEADSTLSSGSSAHICGAHPVLGEVGGLSCSLGNR